MKNPDNAAQQTNGSENIESQMLKQFELTLLKYEEMDALVDRMLNKQSAGDSYQADMNALNRSREDVENLQSQSASLYEAHAETKNKSPKIKRVVDQISSLIQALVAKIDILESGARESYDRLVPQVDENVRSNMMKQAYGQSSS